MDRSPIVCAGLTESTLFNVFVYDKATQVCQLGNANYFLEPTGVGDIKLAIPPGFPPASKQLLSTGTRSLEPSLFPHSYA